MSRDLKDLTTQTRYFKNLGILTYDKIVKQAKLKLMHAVYYKYAPKTFVNVWHTNDIRELNYNLRNMDDFTLPAPKTECFKRPTF